nr:phosphatase PAP2 family protein [uncultured Cohaesibacter sp.]
MRGFQARSKPKALLIKQVDWLLVACLSLSLIALCYLFIDAPAYYWKSDLPKETYRLFRAISRLGKSENFLVPTGLIVIILALLPWQRLNQSSKAILTRLQMMALFVFIAVAGAGLTNNLIKIVIGRARPRYFEEYGAHYFDAPGFISGFQSFPSGHSTTAGAMAVALTLLFPRLKWLWISIGLWIAFSRVAVGAHYPSDIIAGFTYGCCFAWLLAIYCLKRRLLFRAQDGLIRIPYRGRFSIARVMKALHMLVQKA